MSAGKNANTVAEKPKAQPIAGVLLLCLDAVLIVGLLLLAGPCDHGSNPSSCYWACRATLGVAAVIAVLAIVRIFETDEGERRGLSLDEVLMRVGEGIREAGSDEDAALGEIMRQREREREELADLPSRAHYSASGSK